VTRVDCAVDSVVASAYTVPTDQPEADGTLAWTSTTVVVVEVQAGGCRGLGWSYTSAGAVAVVADLLGPVVRGSDALEPTRTHEAMARAVRNVGRQGIAATAISASTSRCGISSRACSTSPCPVARQSPRRRPGLRQWWVHHVRRRHPAGAARTLDRCLRDQRRQDQDRRVLGERGRPRPCARCVHPGRGGSRPGRLRRRQRWIRRKPRDSRGAGGSTTWPSPGSRSRSAPTTSPGWPRCESQLRRMLPPASMATTSATSTACSRPAQLTACRSTSPCAAASPTSCTRPRSRSRSGIDVSAHCAPHLHAHVAAAVPRLRHVEYFHDHVRIEEGLLFDGATARLAARCILGGTSSEPV